MSTATLIAASRPTGTEQLFGKIGLGKLDKKTVQVSGMRGATGVGVQFTLSNVGTAYLRFGADAISFSGLDASQFTIVGGRLPRDIAPGKRATFTVALKASANADVTRVLTAKLSITTIGASSPVATLQVRGLATTGEGSDKEPSLARILDLFQLDINDGDISPNTTFLDLDGSPTDQVSAQRFLKAGSGNVEIDMLAQYANRVATVAGRVGTYDPGTPDSRTQLFSLTGIDSQTVNPVPDGSTQFDPGSKQFGLWAEAPTFVDNGQSRLIYGEDALNTWEPTVANRGKVRVYPLKQDGATVPNAFVVAFEEYALQNDQNDYVFIIRNVKIAPSEPNIGLVELQGEPQPDRLVFNRIENPNPDLTLPNTVHDQSSVRIINTGNKDLILSAITLTASPNTFQITNLPTLPLTIHSNQSFDLNVKFVAHSGDIRTGSIAIASNDSDKPITTVSLAGFWQSDSENNAQGISQEPSLQELFTLFGYRTVATNDGQSINQRGATATVGDEVLSTDWAAADSAKPVTVEELAGYHEQGLVDQIAWYATGHPYYGASDPRNPGPSQNGPQNLLFQNNAVEGQTVLSHLNGSTSAPAIGSFKPGTTTFGFRVSGEYSTDSLNNQVSGDAGGHHWRFFPARDEHNNFIPDTWLVTMDFASINFDYNDHVFLIRNLKPANNPGSIQGLTGIGSTKGNVFDWTDTPGAVNYEVFRADKSNGPYVRISDDVLGSSGFLDSHAPKGRTRYYRIYAVNANGKLGEPANIGVTRPA